MCNCCAQGSQSFAPSFSPVSLRGQWPRLCKQALCGPSPVSCVLPGNIRSLSRLWATQDNTYMSPQCLELNKYKPNSSSSPANRSPLPKPGSSLSIHQIQGEYLLFSAAQIYSVSPTLLTACAWPQDSAQPPGHKTIALDFPTFSSTPNTAAKQIFPKCKVSHASLPCLVWSPSRHSELSRYHVKHWGHF